MSIIAKIVEEIERKGMTQQDMCKILNINSSTFTSWKNRNCDPPVKFLPQICESLDISLDYLFGLDEVRNRKSGNNFNQDSILLQQYSWETVTGETNEDVELYKRVCRSMYMIHGKFIASALLSAIKLPNSKAIKISTEQLSWLAYHSDTHPEFFNHTHILTDDLESLLKFAKSCAHYYAPETNTRAWVKDICEESSAWENNFNYLLSMAIDPLTKREYLCEIYEAFKLYSDEQVELMTYIRQGIIAFEEARLKRIDKRKAEIASIEEETA